MVYWLNSEIEVGGRKTIGLDIPAGADERRVEVVDATPDGGLYFSHGGALTSGRRVKTEHFPKYMKARTKGVIPDFGKWNGLKYVSERFRDIIEKIEPNVHQFVPFQIVASGKEVLADMFFMNICNRLDGMDHERTTLLLARSGMWLPGREVPLNERPANFDPNVKGKFVFNLGQIGDHHLWYDKHSIYGPYLSDQLADSITQADLTGFTLVRGESD